MHIGKLHVVILHFPIALIVAAVVADLLWLAARRAFFKDAGLYCLLGALVTAPPVVLTGWYALGSAGYTGDLAELAEWHEHMGITTLVLVIAASAVRLARLKWQAKWLTVAYPILAAAMFIAVSIAGHLGGQIGFGKDYLSGLF